MKKSIVFISLILAVSCKNYNNLSKVNENLDLVEDSIQSIVVNNFDRDCVFDQETQTDAFLKDIKELDNYFWNSETKTAEIQLNNDWQLHIIRGGCSHFEMSASFVYEGILDFEKDKEQIFSQVIWITSLFKDFDSISIKEALEKETIEIIKDDAFKYRINFKDEALKDIYFMNFNNKKGTTFNIGYSFN